MIAGDPGRRERLSVDQGQEGREPPRSRADGRAGRGRRRTRGSHLHRPGRDPRRGAGRCARGPHPRRQAAPVGQPQIQGPAFGSNAAANWGFQYKDLLTGDEPREVVTIYEIDATGERNWAQARLQLPLARVTDPSGVVHKIIDYPGLPVDHTTTERNWDVLKGIRVPIRPHFGTMGLAPKEADYVNSIPPSYTGGNIDNWRIGKGATMFYPVSVGGALFSVGDPHASQGDSELCGTAIECSLTGTFQSHPAQEGRSCRHALSRARFPDDRDQDDWVLPGFSYANYLAGARSAGPERDLRKSSIDLAMRDAFRKTRQFLMHAKGLTEDEAISLMSVAVDFGITQVVDGNWGVHAIMKKNVFAGRAYHQAPVIAGHA